jgi:hypothetical protein
MGDNQLTLSPSTFVSEPQDVKVNAISVAFPPFRDSNPRLWFKNLESVFALRNITTEITKFHHLLSTLPPHIQDEVEDVIDRDDDDQPYTSLKDAVLRRTGLSDKQRITQLLSGTELGDQKPSQLLRHMQRLAGNTKLDDNLLRQLFMQRLPKDMQVVLSAIEISSVSKQADAADKIWDTYGSRVNQITSDKDDRIDRLTATVQELAQQVASMTINQTHDRSRLIRPKARQRSLSRRTPSRPRDSSICWYHFEHGNDARKCRKPCSFFNKKQGNANTST